MTNQFGWTLHEVEGQPRALYVHEPQQVSAAPQALQYDFGRRPPSQTIDVRHQVRALGGGIGGSCADFPGGHAPVPHSLDDLIGYDVSSARDNYWQPEDESLSMAPAILTAGVPNMNVSPGLSNSYHPRSGQPAPATSRPRTTSELATPMPRRIAHDRLSVTRNRVATIANVKYDAGTHQSWFECCYKKCNGRRCDRYQDLKRHFEATHVSPRVVCQHPGCEWSYPEVRKDKLSEHMKRKHGSAYSTSN
ncbi:hypothetical protein FB567DRAFT_551225 [Paraphoma chrysanthemicola]|uniref:Uncharacterized protein n=1 Tax=Paraphoma chrysanthemicola TaxID=798071 RepID=A0A8K0QZZ9_9PLEO|nr:hypothetical protein FB567DRAFT_551225 [Paraphoma chrysanthemicola]